MNVKYPSSIREEELKNKVAADFFGAFDTTRIIGNVDFCVATRTGGRVPARAAAVAGDSRSPLYWAEAKNHPTDIYRMLAQLILTIGRAACPHAVADARDARPYQAEEPPKFAGCFDNETIAFVEYHYILPVFNLNDFNWTQTPSAVDDKTVETVRGVVPSEKIVSFRFGADDAEIRDFIRRNFTPGEGPALATPIDRNNFTFSYQKWRAEVMPHIDAPWDVLKRKYALYDRDFFLAEMNVDDKGTPEVVDDRPAEDFYITFDANDKKPYCIHRKNEDEFDITMSFGFKGGPRSVAAADGTEPVPSGLSAYSAFWRRYKRPPKREYWDFIVSRLDLLVLGENWQDEYDIWDCTGGTANMEVGLTNKYRVWVSTIDQQDVDVVKERIRNGANLLESHVFRFDFLNDSFDDLPQGLREIVLNPARRRKLVMYFNPPYAEAATTRTKTGTGDNKADVARTTVRALQMMMLGRAVNELFAQFLIRIATEIPGCVVGQFSKLKHLQGPNFKAFRQAFHGTLEKCFIVPADTFDNVKGQFPIGFFVWRLGDGVFASAVADVYDREGAFIGTKSIHSPDGQRVLMDWIRQFYDKAGEHLAYCRYLGSDFQNNNGVFITLSPSANDLKQVKGNWITPSNVVQFAVYFAVRLCIEADWLNDRDQFLYPNDGWREDVEFQSDSLVFTLFSGQNRVSSRDGVNHWIPFTEEEVGAKDCFASHFMSDVLNGKAASPLAAAAVAGQPPYQAELFAAVGMGRKYPDFPDISESPGASQSSAARAVLDAGRELWRYYHAQSDANPNASYYDIRAHFQGCKPNGVMNAKSNDATYNALLAALRTAHKALAAHIARKVYEYGFLGK